MHIDNVDDDTRCLKESRKSMEEPSSIESRTTGMEESTQRWRSSIRRVYLEIFNSHHPHVYPLSSVQNSLPQSRAPFHRHEEISIGNQYSILNRSHD
jgi:hypothetical protein